MVPLDHVLNRHRMQQLRMLARIVKYRCELNQLPQSRDFATFTNVLVSYHCFSNGFGLLDGRLLGLEVGQGEKTAVEFE